MNKSYAELIGATEFTAEYIKNHPADFGGVVVEHAGMCVDDGRGEFLFVSSYYCHQHYGEFCEATLWAFSESTVTYHTFAPAAPVPFAAEDDSMSVHFVNGDVEYIEPGAEVAETEEMEF